PRLKKSAHEVILEFIRSRPPLNPARCRPGNSSRRRSLLPRCTNASWKKSKLRGSWGPCRRARCAGQSWVRTHTHTHTHTHTRSHQTLQCCFLGPTQGLTIHMYIPLTPILHVNPVYNIYWCT
ncbi:unnamed protein product, partial [Tetraodon nigroviridis]